MMYDATTFQLFRTPFLMMGSLAKRGLPPCKTEEGKETEDERD